MANVKRIRIEGWLPFDAGQVDHEAEANELLRMLGQMILPSMGTRLKWGEEKFVPNKHGGRTAMYYFALTGVEAMSWDYLDRFKNLVIAVGGRIDSDDTMDMEA